MPESKATNISVPTYPSLSIASFVIGGLIFMLSQIPLFPAWLSGFFLYSAFYCVIDDILAWPIMLMVGIPFAFLSREMCQRHKKVSMAAMIGAMMGLLYNAVIPSYDQHPLLRVVKFVREDFEMGLFIYGLLVLLGILCMYFVNRFLLQDKLRNSWSVVGMFLGNAVSYVFPDQWCMNPLSLDLYCISITSCAFLCAVVVKIYCSFGKRNYRANFILKLAK